MNDETTAALSLFYQTYLKQAIPALCICLVMLIILLVSILVLGQGNPVEKEIETIIEKEVETIAS